MLLALYPTRAVEQLVLEGDGLRRRARAASSGSSSGSPSRTRCWTRRCSSPGISRSRPPAAFAAAKTFLRHGLAQAMEERDAAESERFLDLWYDPATQDRIGAVVAG